MKLSTRIYAYILPAVAVVVLGVATVAILLYRATDTPAPSVATGVGIAPLDTTVDAMARRWQLALVQDSLAAAPTADPKDALYAWVAQANPSDSLKPPVARLVRTLEAFVSTGRDVERLLAAAPIALPAADTATTDAGFGESEPTASSAPNGDRTQRAELSRNIELLRRDLRAQTEALAKLGGNAANASARETYARYANVALLATGVVVIMLLLLIIVSLRTHVAKPLEDMMSRLQRRKLLIESDSDLGQLGAYLNHTHHRQNSLHAALDRMAAGDIYSQMDPAQFDEAVAVSLSGISRRIEELADERHRLDGEASRLRASISEKERRLATLEVEHGAMAAKLSAVESTLAIAELDDNGRLVYTDKVFAQLSGYTSDELKGRELAQLAPPTSEGDTVAGILQTVREGRTWYGVVQNQTKTGEVFWLASAITPLKTAQNGNGKPSGKYLMAGYEISTLKHQESELRRTLQTVSSDLETYKANLAESRSNIEKLQGEQSNLVETFGYQKQLEFRLMQQQSALQELTRNTDMKSGNVREALRSVTETTAYALDEERVGLWLFIENGAKLRCLDLYERSRLRHTDSLELRQDTAPAFFEAVQEAGVLAAEDARTDERTASLSGTYLIPAGLQSLLSAPIHLGGNVVGFLLVEHPGEMPRGWTLDEQNFVVSVADIVSLALEQGNRRVMEEELRMTLEESQALEEELRQNAEEIEATNEEMRRTQAELKGQINALNNSAIVSETNPQGLITYANNEFSRLYKYDRKELQGQNHRLLKSGHHTPAFFAQLWSTIQAGKVWKGDIRNRARDGNLLWVSTTITPVLGVDGKPYKYIAVGFNVTAQKTQESQIQAALDVAQQQQDMMRHTAEELEYANEEMRRTQIELAGQINALNNSSMVYETDMEGNVTYVNDELLAVTGFAREQVIGHRYTMLKSGRQADNIYQDQWRTVLRGHIWKGELELRTATDKFIWVLITNTPVLDDNGEPIKSINVLFDITAQKEQEFRLKKQQSALLEITGHPSMKEGQLEIALETICRIGRETLGIARASVWLFDPGRGGMVRSIAASQLEELDHPHAVGTLLDRELYPVYFRTLERDRVIAASDATTDPRTKELSFTIFKTIGIGAVLDASVRQGARTVGLISFEHKGSTRPWTLDEQSFATSLADAVAMALEAKERQLTDKLKMAYAELEDKSKEVLRQKAELEEQTENTQLSIKYAKRIQTNILPAKEFIEAHIPNFFIVYRPRDIVGGDFYWFATQGPKKVIVVADGTGHGVPGAFLTLIGYLLLNQIVNEKGITKPGEILYHLHIGVRTALKQDEEGSESRDGMDVAIVTLDTDTKMAQFAGANLPFNYYQDWELHVIKPDKYSIGGEQMEEERTFTNHEVQLKPGDGIYLYTDGFVDQMGGPDEKRFSTRRFRDLVLRTQHESMATQRALVNLEWKEWKDDREQLDDVTVFGMRVD